jgi:hypothetical protein
MSINSYTLIFLLVGHFIGDFLAQSDWMALNKSKWNTSWDGFHALLFHAITVGQVLLIFTTISIWVDLRDFPLSRWFPILFPYIIGYAGVNTILHFLTDALTSKWTTKLWFFRPYSDSNMWRYVEGKRHWFFVVIGLDQLIHAITLILTFNIFSFAS